MGSSAAPGGELVSVKPWGIVSGPGEILPDGSARLLETTTYRSVISVGVPPVVTASHDDPANPVSGLLAGQAWVTPPDPTGEIWVCATFNVPRQVSRVILRQDATHGFPGAPRTWRLQGSRDGKAWTDVVTQDSGDELHRNGAEVVVDFPVARFAKWRVLVDSFTGSAVSLGGWDMLDVAGYAVAAGPAVFETADVSLLLVDVFTFCSPIRERRVGDYLRWSASVDGGATWLLDALSAESLVDAVVKLSADQIRFRVTLTREPSNERSPVAGAVNLGVRFLESVEVTPAMPIPLLGAATFEFLGLSPDDGVKVVWDDGRPVIWRDPRWAPAPPDSPGLNLGEDIGGPLRVPEGAKTLTITAPDGVQVRLYH